MPKFEIRVARILEGGECPAGYQAGDTWIHEYEGPPLTIPNFCAWAFHEMVPCLFVLAYGGRFPWEDAGRATMCCSDSKNPAVFEIRRLDTEAE